MACRVNMVTIKANTVAQLAGWSLWPPQQVLESNHKPATLQSLYFPVNENSEDKSFAQIESGNSYYLTC